MAINKLITGDKLRFVNDSNATIVTFGVINDDKVDLTDMEAAIDIIFPIYGNPYIKIDNPSSKGYTKGAVTLEGSDAEFTKLHALMEAATMQPVSLRIGGGTGGIPARTFFRGIITGVSTSTMVNKPATWKIGQISFIKI